MCLYRKRTKKKQEPEKKLLYQLPIQYYTINRQEYLIHIYSMLNKKT